MWISEHFVLMWLLLGLRIRNGLCYPGFHRFTPENANFNPNQANGFFQDYNSGVRSTASNKYLTAQSFFESAYDGGGSGHRDIRDSLSLSVDGGYTSTDTPVTLKEIEESYIDSIIKIKNQQAVGTNKGRGDQMASVHFEEPVLPSRDSRQYGNSHHDGPHFNPFGNTETSIVGNDQKFTKGEVTDVPIQGFQTIQAEGHFTGSGNHLKAYFRPSEPVASSSDLNPSSLYTGFKPSFGPPVKSKSIDIPQSFVKVIDHYNQDLPGYPKDTTIYKQMSIHSSPYEDHTITESKPPVKVYSDLKENPSSSSKDSKVIFIKGSQGLKNSGGVKATDISNEVHQTSTNPSPPDTSVFYLRYKMGRDGRIIQKNYETPSTDDDSQAVNSHVSSYETYQSFKDFKDKPLKSQGHQLYATPVTPTSYRSFTASSPTSPTYASDLSHTHNYYTIAPQYIQTLKSPKVNNQGEVLPSYPVHELTNLISHDNGFLMTYAPTFAPYTTTTVSSFSDPSRAKDIEELLKAYGIEPSQVEITKQTEEGSEIIVDNDSKGSESENNPISQTEHIEEDESKSGEQLTRAALEKESSDTRIEIDKIIPRTRATTTKIPKSSVSTTKATRSRSTTSTPAILTPKTTPTRKPQPRILMKTTVTPETSTTNTTTLRTTKMMKTGSNHNLLNKITKSTTSTIAPDTTSTTTTTGTTTLPPTKKIQRKTTTLTTTKTPTTVTTTRASTSSTKVHKRASTKTSKTLGTTKNPATQTTTTKPTQRSPTSTITPETSTTKAIRGHYKKSTEPTQRSPTTTTITPETSNTKATRRNHKKSTKPTQRSSTTTITPETSTTKATRRHHKKSSKKSSKTSSTTTTTQSTSTTTTATTKPPNVHDTHSEDESEVELSQSEDKESEYPDQDAATSKEQETVFHSSNDTEISQADPTVSEEENNDNNDFENEDLIKLVEENMQTSKDSENENYEETPDNFTLNEETADSEVSAEDSSNSDELPPNEPIDVTDSNSNSSLSESPPANETMMVPLFFESARMPPEETDDDENLNKTDEDENETKELLSEETDTDTPEENSINSTISTNTTSSETANDNNKSSEEEEDEDIIPKTQKEQGRRIRIKPSVARKLKGHKRITKVKKPDKKNRLKPAASESEN